MKCELCDNDSCAGQPVVMHGRCHIASPTYVTLEVDIFPGKTIKKLTVYCAECDKMISPFTVECDASIQLSPTCHPEAEVWVALHGADDMRIQCSACDKEIAKLKMLGVAR